MAITTSPFVLKDLSLVLVKSDDIAGVETEYRCQLTSAVLTPSSSAGGGGSALETFCESYPLNATAASTTWTLDLSGFQNYKSVEDLSLLLFDHDGEVYTYTLVPIGPNPISDTNPGFTGEVTLAATTIGGTANTHAVFTVSLQCVGRPVKLTAPPVLV